MDKLKNYLLGNFELVFVLVILVSVAGITYFIPNKLAFLNFFFIPVLLAATYLDTHRAVLGAVFCVIMVSIYFALFPESFRVGETMLDLGLNIAAWAGFLILTGVLVGRLQSRLRDEIAHHKAHNVELVKNRESLEAATRELSSHSQSLESKVAERTESLEKSMAAIEELKKKVEDALYNTMDSTVAKLIIEKRLRTEKRRVSVLFSDLQMFTQYSEDRSPEVVITDLNRFLKEMEGVLLDYRGHIDKYVGDAIMVEFGAPLHYDQHALQSVLAALKMQERLTRGDFPWKMRVGIATGEPIMGLIGHRRQSYTAIGDTVNLASRIQSLCVPGGVTVDRYTYDAVKSFVNAQRRTALPFASSADPTLVKAAGIWAEKLDLNPDDREAVRSMGLLLHEAHYSTEAYPYLQQALELDPKDQSVKMAFAEASLKLSKSQGVAIPGKRHKLELFEITGIKDPIMDRSKIPANLATSYSDMVNRLAEPSDDIVHPIEALDGAIGHGRAVGFLAYVLADALDLPESDKRDALMAGQLLDVGKAIVPHHLLNRSGGLSDEEFTEVIKHSHEGARVLRRLGFENEALLAAVSTHHEQYKGNGYPDGLKGDAIPLAGRILAVADSYDALTSWRPYRNRWESRAAFAEIEKETTQGKFDPKIVSLLGKLLAVNH